MLDSASRGDPVTDLRVPRVETLLGEGGKSHGIFILHGCDELLVEFLVNDEVAQAPGGNHGNARLAGPALDGLAQCLPEGIAALGSRLIGGVVGVQHNGHGRNGRPMHDTPINKTEGMPHTLVRRQLTAMRHVEFLLYEGANDMASQICGNGKILLLLSISPSSRL